MQAQDIVASGELPAAWADGVASVTDTCVRGFEDAAEDTDLQNKLEWHGLHAYRYEPCEDGSIVVVYANDSSGNIKLKAFDNMEVASKWTPRAER